MWQTTYLDHLNLPVAWKARMTATSEAQRRRRPPHQDVDFYFYGAHAFDRVKAPFVPIDPFWASCYQWAAGEQDKWPAGEANDINPS